MPYLPPEILQRVRQINVEDAARMLGLSVSKHETRCFMHDDKCPSLKFHRNGHLWKCFVCDIGGGPVELVRNYLGVNYLDACLWLCKQFGISITSSLYSKRILRPLKRYERCEVEKSSFNKEIGEWLVSHAGLSLEAKKFLFDERKFSEEIIRQLNICSVSDSYKLVDALSACFTDNELMEAGYIKNKDKRKFLRFFTPCILFPYYDWDGKLIGIQTRYIGNGTAPRFQFISGFKPSLYNKQVINGINDGDDLYVSEGITDCLALLSSGYKAVAIPSASNLPINEMRRLCRYNLIMSVDRDEAGERAYRILSYNIVKMGGRIGRLDYPQEFKDYGEYFKSREQTTE